MIYGCHGCFKEKLTPLSWNWPNNWMIYGSFIDRITYSTVKTDELNWLYCPKTDQLTEWLICWDNFQICCTDMYVIRFLLNFTVLCLLLWLSRIYLSSTASRPREMYHKPWAASFTLYKPATKNLHLATIFLQLVAKRRPEDFFNFEPCMDDWWNNWLYCLRTDQLMKWFMAEWLTD